MAMTASRLIRPALASDADACAAIYAPYVRATAITFEIEPPSAGDMARRIAAAQERHTWLVLEEDGVVIGYAYAGPFMSRAAYQWSCEVSVYLDSDRRSSGGGSALYAALLPALQERGFRRVIAGVTQPNPASARLHDRFGFEPVGTHANIGWKLDSWHDVTWSQLDLPHGDDVKAAPLPLR